ncbi:hypothetical protein AB0F88_36935 [Streptosporangium sp. NPDC023963]|uniref:hypothetical protein n=1 Tax=Streptosporangium sp. NPDC023963 TaxID=3155608 RepID=UPI0034444E14
MPINPPAPHPADEVPSDAANLKISLQSPEGLDVTASSEMSGSHLNRFWDVATTVAAIAATALVPLFAAKELVMLPAHLASCIMAAQMATVLSIYALWRSRKR